MTNNDMPRAVDATLLAIDSLHEALVKMAKLAADDGDIWQVHALVAEARRTSQLAEKVRRRYTTR